jgi:two-component system, NarL family, response regulator DevR
MSAMTSISGQIRTTGHEEINADASSPARKSTVVVVDPHQVIRLGIKALLAVEANFQLIAERGDIRSGLYCVSKQRPEVVITDVVGWPVEGYEWIRRLLQTVPRTRIVVYSASAEERYVRAALAGGASAYVLKQHDGQLLLRAVDAAVRGDMLLDAEVTPTVVRCIRSETTPQDQNAFADLSRQEARILALVAEGHPNSEIASRVHLSAKTVRNYVSHILAKLNLQTRTQAAAYAIRHGIEPLQLEHDRHTGVRNSYPDADAIRKPGAKFD